MKYSYSTAWIFQKLLAIIFLLLLIYVIFSLNNISLNSYLETTNWFSNKFNSFLFFILFTSIVLHSNLGLNSIIDDLRWLGINFSKVIKQSDRLKLYKDVFEELKKKNLIYPCFQRNSEMRIDNSPH